MIFADETRISLSALEHALRKVERSTLLVSPRILRRVIKHDRHLAGLGLQVPHRKSYLISRDRLLEIADRSELELLADSQLPEQVLLLAKPTEDEEGELSSTEEVLHTYWRLLFHIRIHAAFEQRLRERSFTLVDVARRIRELGEVEFAEIRSVLLKEDFTLPPRGDAESYVEFAAVYLELLHFCPDDLPRYFPAIRDHDAVLRVLARDVDHESLFHQTRLPNAPARCERPDESLAVLANAAVDGPPSDPLLPSPPLFWSYIARAERAGSLGNGVKAAILRTRAARQALPDRVAQTRHSAEAELRRFLRRLQTVLDLSHAEANDWAAALLALLEHAAQGVWTTEARLLYDLQKVCVEHERGVYTLDLIAWCRSLGRVPLRRPLPLLREVLITKHLRSAVRRLSTARLSGMTRERFAELLDAAVRRVEDTLREQVRPQIVAVLDSVGLVPQNVPERIARDKLTEELLDRIVEHGFLNMGDFRDALSKNNLKIPDLSGPAELLLGDPLLRADFRLGDALDGVYHRGAIYLRFSQRLSSLAFGTPIGRFLTKFVVLPFGGAFVGLVFLDYLMNHLGIGGQYEPSGGEEIILKPHGVMPSSYSVAVWGVFVFLMIHSPRFRAIIVAAANRIFQAGRLVLYDLPAGVLRSPLVQRILQGWWFRAVRGFVLKPALFAAVILAPFWLRSGVSTERCLLVFLLVNLVLNSPLGRHVDEWLADLIARILHELRMRVFLALARFFMDISHHLLQALERLLYTVDEWLRFRTDESQLLLGVKAVLGLVWFLVTYVIRFSVTLLIEPQVNPIKHFPVVTVSHKVLWLNIATIVYSLQNFTPLGPIWANTLATVIVFGTPGVFGFLVWELRENWRLYAANRRPSLRPTLIGQHGETLLRFLRPGFHSGTLPKLFNRLRRAARRARRTGRWKAVHHFDALILHVEVAVRHFIARELLALLSASRGWQGVPLEIAAVRLATNRIDIELRRGDLPRADLPGQSLVITFDDVDGRLFASISRAGWLTTLDAWQREVLNAALAGLYKLAGIEAVREPRDADFGETPLLWSKWVEYWEADQQAAQLTSPDNIPPLVLPMGSGVQNSKSALQGRF